MAGDQQTDAGRKEKCENALYNPIKATVANEQEIMKQRLCEWRQKRHANEPENAANVEIVKTKRIKQSYKNDTKPHSFNDGIFNLKMIASNKIKNKEGETQPKNEHNSFDQASQYRRLVNRNKALRLATKIEKMKKHICTVDARYKSEFGETAQQISQIMSDIKSFWEVNEKLKYVRETIKEIEQKMEFWHSKQKTLQMLSRLICTSAQLFAIEGEIYFEEPAEQQLAFSAENLDSLLSPEHLKVLALKTQIHRQTIEHSLLGTRKTALEAEIKALSEQISLLKMKLSLINKA